MLFTAIVSAMTRNRPIPTGSLTFLVDGVAVGPAVRLDRRGRARLETKSLGIGERQIRAVYAPGDKCICKILTWLCLILTRLGCAPRRWNCVNTYYACTSPNLLHTVAKTKPVARRDS